MRVYGMGTVLTRIITYLVTSSATVSGMGPHPILFSPLPSFLRSAILIVGKGLSRSCLVLNWAHRGVSGSLGNAEEIPIWTKCSRVVLQQVLGCLTFDPRKNHTIFQRHIRLTILETKKYGWFDWAGIHQTQVYSNHVTHVLSRPITKLPHLPCRRSAISQSAQTTKTEVIATKHEWHTEAKQNMIHHDNPQHKQFKLETYQNYLRSMNFLKTFQVFNPVRSDFLRNTL